LAAEVRLLAAARANMEERVACQVEGETAARLAAARRRMAVDVNAQVVREQAALLSERQVRSQEVIAHVVERELAGVTTDQCFKNGCSNIALGGVLGCSLASMSFGSLAYQ
jgi:hypothetical protein